MRTLIFPLLLLSTQTASAENPSSDPHQTIVVTASRTPITLGAAGSGTSVITREDIERRGPSFLTDLLRDEAGFSVSRGGGMGQQTQLRIRGGEADHVLVLIDGIEANDLTRGGGFDFAHLLAADIERVEIVRGPQSALWGSDAISGVVNIVTRAGGATPHASLAVEGGSFGTVNTSGLASGGYAVKITTQEGVKNRMWLKY
jgi:vitamin B12 transporter